MVSTASGRVKIFLALADWSAKNFIQDSFLFSCHWVVEQLESVLLKLLDRIIHVVWIMFNSDAAAFSELVDIFVTVVNQKTLLSVVFPVGFLAVS
jgi:hypothetical protein